MGSWDNSDVGKKKKWSADDKSYDANQKQSLGVDWTGSNPRSAPRQPQKPTPANTKKKMFGMF
jgi:hypothetical protein